ncbi:hypothetical protein Talka_00974 [Tepidimonas alkaliphilus]|uniref:Uncharacterized protein n=1 Tax=Tepidimonas alkaliphilus TaxID=2588942 RepID=A0A554W926_9BURK|nr:hypothetical protein Talka_00974 [Tepidimonas alkaliphilus]
MRCHPVNVAKPGADLMSLQVRAFLCEEGAKAPKLMLKNHPVTAVALHT